MAHLRKQIRDAAVTAVTGLGTTGTNVFASRVHPFHNDAAELPGLALYTTDEEIANDEGDEISKVQQRFTFLVIEGYATDTEITDLDDTLDAIAAEVETAIFADQFFGELAHGTDLIGTEIGLAEEVEKPLGIVRLIFRVFYMTNQGAPEAKA